MLKAFVPANLAGLGEGLDFIEKSLKELKIKPKNIKEALLLSEESMVRLIEHCPIGGSIHIHVHRSQGIAKILISTPGDELSRSELDMGFDITGKIDRGVENSIRDILFRAFEDKHRYYRKGRYNFFRIVAGEPEKIFAAVTILSFVAAIAIGLIMNALMSAPAQSAVNAYVFAPVQQIFIKLLMLCTAPAVFFSIITGVAQYSSFSDPGRVSVKVIVGYMITSILAIAIGALSFNLLRPGSFGVLESICEGLSTDALHLSFVDTLIGIVPTDVVTPFLNLDAAQLVFFALICGVALGRIGDYSASLRSILDALNMLFSKVADILMNFIPLATFCSTISLIFNFGTHILLDLAEMVGTLLVALLVIAVIDCLIVIIGGRVNPLVMFRKFAPCLKEVLIRSSGMSVLPKSMRCCRNALGISEKVYSFSLPFGASVNMDGNCIYLTVAGLFLARMCGIEITSNDILPLAFFVLVVTMGAPISRGTVLLCLTVMLGQMGVSSVALSLLIGIDSAIEMLLAASDTLGDVAVTIAVAGSEELLDKDIYYSKAKAHSK